jgi:GNAT superfamily N-acetyltransferase
MRSVACIGVAGASENSGTSLVPATIAMLKILPEYQGREIGSGLLKAAMREAPGPVDPGWQTDQGHQFWERRGREIAETYKPPQWTPELPEFDAADVRPEHDIPEPEFDVELGG